MFGMFSNDGSFKFKNSKFDGEYIFLLYDLVHILKNIRNNWLNKSDSETFFCYPNFETNQFQLASFQHLRTLYNIESPLFIKKAHKLNKKNVISRQF